MSHDVFESPLNTRYCSDEMKFVWSPQFKHQTWRQMWVWVAEAQLELDLRGPDGQPVVQQSQIDDMKKYITDINWAEAQAEEKKRRHDRDPCQKVRPKFAGDDFFYQLPEEGDAPEEIGGVEWQVRLVR